MKRTVSILWMLVLPVFLFGDGNDAYKDASGWFGIDPNAGLNSFLTLLIPSGGKYEGMATAYTAMALDGGYLEANPAAGAFLPRTELAFTHNDWIADSALEGVYYTFRPDSLEDMGLGFAGKFLHVPFTGYNAWGDRYNRDHTSSAAAGWYSELIVTGNISYNFLRNYYFDGLSVGASLKAGYRGVTAALEPGQSAVALMGDVGAMTRFNFLKGYASRERNFTVGVALRNLGAEFINDPDPLPTQFGAGIAYKPIRPLTVALDVTLPFNLNGAPAEIISGAIGVNVAATEFLSVHGGVLIKTGKPRITLGADVAIKNFSIIANYTLDLATQFKLFDRISIGLKIDMATVNQLIVREEVQALYLDGLEYYAKGDLTTAIRKWEECLSMDPLFRPAAEMIETANENMQLQNDLRDAVRSR